MLLLFVGVVYLVFLFVDVVFCWCLLVVRVVFAGVVVFWCFFGSMVC